MSEGRAAGGERPVLILAPAGRDGSMAMEVLGGAGIRSEPCADLSDLLHRLGDATGALLVTEEALETGGHELLAERLAAQEPWSDLPVLVLTRRGADSATATGALHLLGNVTLLERPARVAALVSAVRAALRARERQHELREQVQALRESEARFRTMADSSPAHIWMIDAGGVIEFVNKAFLDFVGIRAEDVPNFQWQAILHPEDGAEYVRSYRAAIREGTAWRSWGRIRRADGAWRWLESRGNVRVDGAGQVNGLVGTSIDLTEMIEAQDALKDADRRKDEFLATLAHELRNPLAPLRSGIFVLQQKAGESPLVSQMVAMMDRQVNHMVRLVDDLLEISRITRGTIDLRRVSVDLAAILRGAVEASRPLLEASRHDLAIELPAEQLVLQADPDRLTQVFTNLLNNAAKFTDEGGQVTLAARREGTQVVVTVRDSGIGIDEETLPLVFDMFAQSERAKRRGQGGLGIGLTLVRTLVEMHGGTVMASSGGAGKGSEFVVRLPLAAPPEPLPAPAGQAGAGMLAGLRVLVIDDNRDGADSLAMLLRSLGAESRVVYSGAAALDLLDHFQPSAVLMDIGMPDMDGYELARRIRREEAHRGLPLIALTGWGQDEDRRRSRQAGFDHHLTKPADLRTLSEIIVSLAGGARAPSAPPDPR